jgi:hypothetical protein
LSQTDQKFDALTATAKLRIGNQKLELRLVVPAGEVPAETLLPTLHELSNRVAEGVEERVQKNGLKISCRKGCGACCRQPVPISRAEARLLAGIVHGMPDEAQVVIRELTARCSACGCRAGGPGHELPPAVRGWVELWRATISSWVSLPLSRRRILLYSPLPPAGMPR